MSDSEKKKIFMVDDSKVHLNVVANMLKDRYEIIGAVSGKKALELLKNGVIPDLILLDILMPDMDGWNLYKRIKSIGELHYVPIAFLTSQHGEEDEKNALHLGADDYIVKPFNKEDLLRRIEAIINKSKK